MISNLLMATGGLLAAFAPEFFTFVACRALAGFAIAGVEVGKKRVSALNLGYNSAINLKRCCCRRRALSWVWSLLDQVSGPWLAFFAGKTPCKIKFTYDAV